MILTHSLIKIIKTPKQNVTVSELLAYPAESLGFHLGSFVYKNHIEPNPVPEKEDIYRLLINREVSDREEVAMHYYLFGNGDRSLRTIFIIATGAIIFPHHLKFFCSRYRDGKNTVRFYDLDHFRMLHLPLHQIKDAFRLR